MYILMTILLMFVLPIASILGDRFLFRSPLGIMSLIGKWFVFWAMGVRLFTAGLHQSIRPRFTAETILRIKGMEQFIVVQELGFANLAMGLLGLGSLLALSWVLPAAVVGSLFIGLAGIRHVFSKGSTSLEKGAMLSNLVVACLFLSYILWTALQ